MVIHHHQFLNHSDGSLGGRLSCRKLAQQEIAARITAKGTKLPAEALSKEILVSFCSLSELSLIIVFIFLTFYYAIFFLYPKFLKNRIFWLMESFFLVKKTAFCTIKRAIVTLS